MTDRSGGTSSRGSLKAQPTSGGGAPKTDRSGRSAPPPPTFAIGETDADGRVPCARCGRKFAPDRIAQHQFICVQLKRGPAKPPEEVRQRAEQITQSTNWRPGARVVGGGRGRGARGTAGPSGSGGRGGAAARGPARPAPAPASSKWRAQSMELQAAMRAARAGARHGARAGSSGGGWGGGDTVVGGGGASSNSARRGGGSRPQSRPTLAQRRHAAEHERGLQEAMHAAAPRSARTPPRAQVDGSRIMVGGGGLGARSPGASLMGGGGGFDPTSNRTSADNPFYRGY